MQLLEPIQSLLNSIEGEYAQYKQEVIKDFWICLISRECSLLGRKEVLTGKAKFGILGDGKEVPQVAMARSFRKGDFRTGYYRDQTFMMALGLCSVKDYFAQLYADPYNDPFSRGRQMNAHFATPLISDEGEWLDQTNRFNVSSDVSSTAGQMARALGLALASKYYKGSDQSNQFALFSNQGREVSFCTIGDASTSEGAFWETLNAAGVMQVPLAVSVWDDGYGISVPIELQTIKKSISLALSGFAADNNLNGIKIFKAKAWDYPTLVTTYKEGIDLVREQHIPALFHIEEVTQPQGHSTSGSHERYKSKARMEWELKYDCIKVMSEWMISKNIIEADKLHQLEELSKQYVKEEKQKAWSNSLQPIIQKRNELIDVLNLDHYADEINILKSLKEPGLSELVEHVRTWILDPLKNYDKTPLKRWLDRQYREADQFYHTHLYSETTAAAVKVEEVPARYSETSKELNGYQVLNAFFDQCLEKDNRIIAFGEDVGKIGDVNQGFAGLQEKYGVTRVFDTGIREWTIIGQAIGCAMRGLRPIAEIQYLDYIVYALSPLMDDLATLRYRSAGLQASPAIIRTRGHRLEGIWHTGSPMGMLLNSLRGIYICVPRNMTQAAGMYNTLLKGDDPGLVIECLNGYRLKEVLPDNIKEFTVSLGKVETLIDGNDITLVSYGSCIRIAQKAIDNLRNHNISVELIDIQTLIPFDLSNDIRRSVAKTNKLIVLDEDVPGAASAFILQQILEKQNAFELLDSSPVTITAKDHRSPYGSSGDYFTKPSVEDIMEAAIKMMHEYDPQRY
jgi:pyruvate/2-oxoglutarate/acetoin dehydrogenase E1 component/TPP-dependent pyruvate/acetoin dehydrogenase alpha subunit